MQTDSFKSERLHGIDVLRVILSFCVITLHILYYGGFWEQADPSDPTFYFLWFVGIAIDGTVNCFAIITGFVLYNKPTKYSGVLYRFLTVLYHGLLITALFWIFCPEIVHKANWIQALFPIAYEEFWYFTAYFGAFFFAPLVSKGMQALSRKQANVLVLALILVFSIIPTATGKDPFHLKYGYSAFWLLILFTIGAYLRKYHMEFRFRPRFYACLFAGCILVTCLGVVLSMVYPSFYGMRLIEYTSPTIVLAAIAIVLLFASVRVSPGLQKICVFCTSFTFSIYLLHEQPLVRQSLINDRFVPVLSLSGVLQLAIILASTVVIWVVCFCLDLIRQLVFRILKIDSLLHKVDKRLQS